MSKGREFLEEHLGFSNITEHQVAIVNLLLYHSFGPSAKKGVNQDSIIYQLLGDEGMRLFKQIFDNNSKELVKEFFEHPFIRMIWPEVVAHLTHQVCFDHNGPNPEIELTFREITRIMTYDYRLPMPQWWEEKFPIIQ